MEVLEGRERNPASSLTPSMIYGTMTLIRKKISLSFQVNVCIYRKVVADSSSCMYDKCG